MDVGCNVVFSAKVKQDALATPPHIGSWRKDPQRIGYILWYGVEALIWLR